VSCLAQPLVTAEAETNMAKQPLVTDIYSTTIFGTRGDSTQPLLSIIWSRKRAIDVFRIPSCFNQCSSRRTHLRCMSLCTNELLYDIYLVFSFVFMGCSNYF
jgi:hypothetical protein